MTSEKEIKNEIIYLKKRITQLSNMIETSDDGKQWTNVTKDIRIKLNTNRNRGEYINLFYKNLNVATLWFSEFPEFRLCDEKKFMIEWEEQKIKVMKRVY